MTIEEFTLPWKALCTAWKEKASPELTAIYYESLKHLTAERWDMAVKAALRTHKYASLPLPATLLEAIGMGPDDDAQAMIAIEKIKHAMRNYGEWHSIVFDDPIIHMLIGNHTGSWISLCHMTIDEHMWLFKEWVKKYKVFMNNPIEYPPRLIGETEGQLTFDMLPDRLKAKMQTVYVGDKARCLEIEGDARLQIDYKQAKPEDTDTLKTIMRDAIRHVEEL